MKHAATLAYHVDRTHQAACMRVTAGRGRIATDTCSTVQQLGQAVRSQMIWSEGANYVGAMHSCHKFVIMQTHQINQPLVPHAGSACVWDGAARILGYCMYGRSHAHHCPVAPSLPRTLLDGCACLLGKQGISIGHMPEKHVAPSLELGQRVFIK